jgi:radical SAM superfamily enzyme YgiQ (UPF0313 family)
MGTVTSTKGCVARCTFCHRWDKGFRQLPPEKVIQRIRYLMDRYQVGFVLFGDENFGSDLKALDELVRFIQPLDILWQVAGVRACTIDSERLKRMRDAGCVALYYGFETGSPEILKVMEKNLDLEDNLRAARSTFEAGLFTVYQLVLGMPGETPRTINDTLRMVKQITEFLPEPAHRYLSINYIQALPGTPVYEYARAKGLIGPRLEDEDRYLFSISDVNAGDDVKFLNFSSYPYLTVQSWRPRILYEATTHWQRVRAKRGMPVSLVPRGSFQDYDRGGYFNLHQMTRSPWLLRLLYPIRGFPIGIWTLVSVFRRGQKRIFFSHLWEWLCSGFVRKPTSLSEVRSLRRILQGLLPVPTTPSQGAMAPLRQGR